MRLLRRRQSPTQHGKYAALLHVVLTVVMPLLLYVLVVLGFTTVAFGVVLLSKWRMVAVKSRHWLANFRANAVDIFVGFSAIIFMSLADGTLSMQLFWVVMYTGWLLFIKPQSNPLWVGVQALIAQTSALIAIFLVWNDVSETALTFAVWMITYLCARHFLTAFDEAMARATAYVWAFFCASLAWLSTHWLLYYYSVSQPALIITVIGYGMAALYYLDHTQRLRPGVRRQFVSLMVLIIALILVFSDWSGDII